MKRLAALLLALGCHKGADGGQTVSPTLGLTWHVAMYEAEDGTLAGGAKVVGNLADRTVGDLGGEASQRQAVTLSAEGDSVSWKVAAAEAGANAIVIRFSIPDAPGGGGASGSAQLDFGSKSQKLQLTSRYAWLYGGQADGTKLYDVPANAAQYGTANTQTHLYDEFQLMPGISLNAGDNLELSYTDTAITVDFIDLETVPAALPQPTGYLSFTDPQCGGVGGAGDSDYGTFQSTIGTNPYNPTSFGVKEKDYYSSPQDTQLFAVADANFKALQTCLSLGPVYLPPGNYYIRGSLPLASGATIQGAGIWYSRFVAVDTDAPQAATANGVTGIASVSGDLNFRSQSAGTDGVTLANFAMFGNVTQRDTVDAVSPIAVHGEFTNSRLDNLWVEHYFIGLNLNGDSSNDSITFSRVRDTFADGIDFYGSTANSTIDHCSTRNTGDDGFALWSQGTSVSDLGRNDVAQNSSSALNWFGNGFSIYGGTGNSLKNDSAADILNYPCVQISTQFVPVLPESASMTASASGLVLERCGGNGFGQKYGSLLIGAKYEDLSSVVIDSVKIDNPSYSALDFRNMTTPPDGGETGIALSNIEITGSAACAAVKGGLNGSVSLSNVCLCPDAGPCPVTNTDPNFTFGSNTCTSCN